MTSQNNRDAWREAQAEKLGLLVDAIGIRAVLDMLADAATERAHRCEQWGGFVHAQEWRKISAAIIAIKVPEA